jgi:hypothetical protein
VSRLATAGVATAWFVFVAGAARGADAPAHASPLLAGTSAPAAVAADTTVEGFVRSMSDSTDRWFGLSAEPADTSGIDSTRAFRLSHPVDARTLRHVPLAFLPRLAFNRVSGPVMGGEALAGSITRAGRLSADAAWASGADRWLGGGSYQLGRGDSDEPKSWRLRLRAGRDVQVIDRDEDARVLSVLRAFVSGRDHNHYLRRDGARLELERTSAGGQLGAGARDQLESPMATTASWYLTGHHPVVVGNEMAAAVRVHELLGWGSLHVPFAPWTLAARVWRAGAGLGGDASYTRTRASLGGANALGRHLTWLTQLDYGRLHGDALPQAAFYAGEPTLFSLEPNALRGTGRALARTEMLLVDPLQRVLGLEQRPTVPLQVSAFVGSGAVWGFDPASGLPQRTSRDWPQRGAWLSEAGVSLLYRPGLPEPDSYVRFTYAWPLGPGGGRSAGASVSYTRALNFLPSR